MKDSKYLERESIIKKLTRHDLEVFAGVLHDRYELLELRNDLLQSENDRLKKYDPQNLRKLGFQKNIKAAAARAASASASASTSPVPEEQTQVSP